jgi:hypothetical protein
MEIYTFPFQDVHLVANNAFTFGFKVSGKLILYYACLEFQKTAAYVSFQ